jgi:hypothetical protein
MASLIVIRIVPQGGPIGSIEFETYLSASGGLTINAYQIDYQTVGEQPPPPPIGSATYVPTPPPGPGGWGNSSVSFAPPVYPGGLVGGIIQQVDYIPPSVFPAPPVPAQFDLESVATAIISINAAVTPENIRLELVWGGGPPTPVTPNYYDVAVVAAPAPDLTTWVPDPSGLNPQPDPWAQLAANATSLYLELSPPPAANAASVQLPNDGSPPPFETLLAAMMQILGSDPGGGFSKTQLGGMTSEQCQNLAYEILWSQQPPPPSPPSGDPLEALYTNPPNDGNLLNGTTPNQQESDRRQFEAQLQSYYAVTDAAADRLKNYVFSVCAAVACEIESLDASEVALAFPADPSAPNSVLSEAAVVFTGIQSLAPALNFGVPAGYFYALASAMPTNITAAQRYTMATGDQIQHTLNNLTTAIVAQTISDAEKFVTTGGSINAAQAARRVAALSVANSASIPLAPLGAFALSTSALSPAGADLTFISTAAISGGLTTNDGVTVTGGLTASSAGLAVNTTVQAAPNAITAQVAPAFAAAIPAGTLITFSPVNPPQMRALINSWLAFPPTPAGQISSQAYSPSEDAASFWPAAAAAEPLAFLNLVLSAVTQGFIIPPPFNEALGSEIAVWLAKPPVNQPQTVAGLAAVTVQQWTALFRENPTWLPGQQGDDNARTAAFLQSAKMLLSPPSSTPLSSLNLATSAATPNNSNALPFASTAGVVGGMSVTSASTTFIQPGTIVQPPVGPTAVNLSLPTKGGVIPFGANILFTPNVVAAPASSTPLLQAPPTDWIAACLTAYDPAYKIGAGLNQGTLATAAATVFPGDAKAQAWLVDAVTALDAHYQVIGKMAPPPTPAGFAFAIVEALYARGFVSAASITAISGADFQQALIGTIAYDSAAAIYTAAQALAPNNLVSSSPGPFQPINPDGSLVNCLPPPCRSPFGPIAYLSEMLQVSEASTCESPLTPNSADTLGAVLATRRGPLGQISASCANLETPLPLIDIVNENLEYMGSNLGQAHGIVHDTAEDSLAGFPLCRDEPCEDEARREDCCDPAEIFGALPEYSSPMTTTLANGAIDPPIYDTLKSDFSACVLPYSQPLDVNRTYMRHLGSCRFEEMRTFRKCITEFVLYPVDEPVGFQSYLWRYPVRIEIAVEYLGLTPEEYSLIFQGLPDDPCAPPEDRSRDDANVVAGSLAAWRLFGFADPANPSPWTQVVVSLPQFLERTCLTYCEFIDLWKSGFVAFGNRDDEKEGKFPACEPCCLEQLTLQLPGEREGWAASLGELGVFIQLWRILKRQCCEGYSFAELSDICQVLGLFTSGAINRDFIRQLAALKMLCDHFDLPLVDRDDPPPVPATGAERTALLALWAQPQPPTWAWAVRQLIAHVERHAIHRHRCERRKPEFLKILVANLDPLSRLAGFDPASATDNWHAAPTHTLRFAEILSKIYASPFSVGEIVYLFTAEPHLDGDDPFALQTDSDALDSPLDLPEESHEHSLWRLRDKLLEANEETDEESWTWKRVEVELQSIFGFAAADIQALGAHFFPDMLRQSGVSVAADATRFFSALPSVDTTAATWNTPPDGPFQYDAASEKLTTQVPLADEAVLNKLKHVHDLDAQERAAVQDLYFQPRALLARFALLFGDFRQAQELLVATREESERWAYFKRQFALCRRRCHIIADHLASHVAAATGAARPEESGPAMLILRTLFADENNLAGSPPASWENDNGGHPPVLWTPPPNGGAFAGLLGLTGTGLLAEMRAEGGALVWRDASGALSAFGEERDRDNCPLPTVTPALDVAIAPQQLQFVSVHNGLLMKDATGAWLGGAQGFEVKWSGGLLVDRDGRYEFFAGAPTPEGEKPDVEAIADQQWRVVLSRGQRTWVILAHRWPGEEASDISTLPLKRGAYEVTIELRRPTPEFHANESERRQRTGLEVKYAGPDSDGRRIALPHDRLFLIDKDAPLGQGVATIGAGAADYLATLYVSSFRDARRTYQRAFKALLFAHRFALSAHRRADGASELGYMLAQKTNFAGVSYYRSGGGFTQHAADFDFNYLPVLDDYHAPTADARAYPSVKRIQAMFDWWERIYDYAAVRAAVRRRCDRRLWHLFDEAFEKNPVDPSSLLRHIGADSRHWSLDLHFFQAQYAKVYVVDAADLEDERWAIRAWRADEWLRAVEHVFAIKDIVKARPDLWASDDPGALVAGEIETGNANLIAFVCEGSFDNGAPRRYEEVRKLDDAIRERSRAALLAYLCAANRVALPPSWPGLGFATVPRDLSDLLLLDVEAGLCERASRIDEGISAVQSFIRRARIGLEPQWTISGEFARMWDREFATFHVWQACKRRHLYKENWIEWDEVAKARRIEAFAFLESKLRTAELTSPKPGGLDWWPDETIPIHQSLERLQKAEVSQIQAINPPREGLGLLGTLERDARPSWLSPVNAQTAPPPGDLNNPAAGNPPPSGTGGPLPLWMQAAIRLGAQFIRVAAAGVPPAGSFFEPHKGREPGCVCCCEECGCEHPLHVDEYYFWLIGGALYDNPTLPPGFSAVEPDDGYQYGYQDDFYDPVQQEAAYWWDPTQLPQLLQWHTMPTVRLAWCRVHNGEFQQPRRSPCAVAVQGSGADLQFVRRAGDSLYFSVTNAEPPLVGYVDTEPPGFRYDICLDETVTLPLISKPQPDPSFVNSQLPVYPYFLYVSPGDRLFPLSPYAPAISVAKALRAHCRFEAALKWYRLAFDPVTEDCAWLHCPVQAPNWIGPPNACCDSTDVSCEEAANRSIVLNYLETLREWGDAIMRRGESREAFQQARVVFDAAKRILGERPDFIRLPEPTTPQTIGSFKPDYPPLNPRLLDLYDVVHDRLRLIHECQSRRRLRMGASRKAESYFGDDPVREGWRLAVGPCAEESEWCQLASPYRFAFLIQKAQDYTAKAQELGAALLAAFEKGDAEYLASLRSQHERELLIISLDAKKDQWRDADWQVQALQKTKAISQTNLSYYSTLIQNGLIGDEIAYQDLTAVSTGLRGASNIIEATGEASNSVGNFFDGVAGFGGTPLIYEQLPIGEPLGSALAGAARIMNSLAEIASSTAGLMLTEAGWQRRNDEWVHQTQVLTIEIQQVERQILGAQRRRDQMLVELNSHRRQIEQAEEVQDFLRDKFTAHDLYLSLQRETSALYFQTYDLALHAARQAERAFNLERGHLARRFLPEAAWDRLQDGLQAGDRLSASLRHMEKTYFDENIREYELTKHISLRVNFPAEFLRLKTEGRCEIDIPEWMFDVDYPGQYMRRIRNVSLTIPCVAGPYTGVHCRLTLLSNVTRINPLLTPPPHGCCCPPRSCCCQGERSEEGYPLCADDPRMVKLYGAREAIATSGGQNDSGLFELSFNDPRYLPFEYMGAVSRWRIELPKENNYFDFDSLTDTILHLNYTSREGGEALRRAAAAAARRRTPGDGWAFLDVRHEFPDAWELFHRSFDKEVHRRELRLRLSRRHFPFLPHDPEIIIRKIALLFETEEPRDHSCPEREACPCPERKHSAFHIVELSEDCDDRDHGERSVRGVKCVSADEWRGLYDGIAELEPRPFRRGRDWREFRFHFPREVREVIRVYLLCGYEMAEDCCCDSHPQLSRRKPERDHGRLPSKSSVNQAPAPT